MRTENSKQNLKYLLPRLSDCHLNECVICDLVLFLCAPAGNSAGRFAIDPTTGALTVAAALDYETAIQYILTVQATDGGSPTQTGSATVTVDVNDVSDERPTCTTNAYSITINEPGVITSNNVRNNNYIPGSVYSYI